MSQIYKHMTVVSKSVYINKLDEVVGKYNKTYHRAIKMKPADVKPGTHWSMNWKNILNSRLVTV